MLIRAFTPDDFPALAAIYDSCTLDELVGESCHYTLIPLRQDSRRLPLLMATTIYLIEEQAIVGFGAHRGEEITALYIHPDYRGQGAGKRLLEFLLQCTGPGACLKAAASNIRAIELYQKYGFTVEKHFLTDYGTIPVQAVYMVRRAEEGNGTPASPVQKTFCGK